MRSVVNILSAISNEKALLLFKTIAQLENYNTDMLIKKLRVNRKQFYFIMKKLRDVHLVRRIDGRYHLTSFGKVVYRAQARVEIAVENHWKLKALDSVIMSVHKTGLSAQERQMFIDKLIENYEIKNILFSK
jgi:predicted transcriptional regulator